jgi:hypothetical protein
MVIFENKKMLAPPREISFVCEKYKRGIKEFFVFKNYHYFWTTLYLPH